MELENDVISITKKLVSIPSYLSNNTNEVEVGNYIVNYLENINYLKVEKQHVENGRFNIIASDGSNPKLMFCCHMDTVMPSGNWSFGPLTPNTTENKLYGLGVSDMKGGMACVLSALKKFKETKGLFLLFDIDEEYYFNGVTKFLEKYTPKPELIILTEPGMNIKNGHRGVIEIYFKVRGVTGHSARPELSKNVLLGVSKSISTLISFIELYKAIELGDSTFNLAYLHGGVSFKDANKKEIIMECGNKVPDIAEGTIEIRNSTNELTGDIVVNKFKEILISNGLTIDTIEKRIDKNPFIIEKNKLSKFEHVIKSKLGKVDYADISRYGYGEGQLLNETLGVPCVYFGPGPDSTAHKTDEYVFINELKLVEDIIISLITEYCDVKYNK